MNIRTKVMTTIIAMVCSLSVSATGIAAIIMDFPISVANTTSIAMGEIQGDLYGERTGANGLDIMQHLYKNGVGVQDAEMNYFCEDVSFSPGSKEIEYVFKFVLAEGAQNGAMVKLTNANLTNSVIYTASYSYAYGQTRPDWKSSNALILNQSLVVDEEKPFLWLRARLVINTDTYSRIDTSATWSFSFNFEGIATTE